MEFQYYIEKIRTNALVLCRVKNKSLNNACASKDYAYKHVLRKIYCRLLGRHDSNFRIQGRKKTLAWRLRSFQMSKKKYHFSAVGMLC